MITIEQWHSFSDDTKMKLISEVFNSSYLALTHFAKNPLEDTVVLVAMRVSTLVGNVIHIDIHKEIQI